jgi:hypothetical protein
MKKTVIAGFVILVIIGTYYYTQPSNAVLAIEPTIKNLGEVSQKKGIVSTDFTLTNKGNEEITISEIQTSCMCTTAKILTEKGESKTYGMHGDPSGKTIIPQGGTATLRVMYDPNVHRELKGGVSRTVTLRTNAGVKNVRINLDQVP